MCPRYGTNAWTRDYAGAKHRKESRIKRLERVRELAQRIFSDACSVDSPRTSLEKRVFDAFSDATEGLTQEDRDSIWTRLQHYHLAMWKEFGSEG